MTVVAILLGIACIYLIIHKLLVTKEIKRMAKEMKQNGTDNSNCQLTLQMMNQPISDLAAAINSLQQHHQDEVAEYIRREEEYKQSMADISHDLRTPLTAMTGYLKLLRKTEAEPDKKQEYVEIAYEKADTLNQLVTSLFELARLECSAYQFTWENIDIKEIVEQELAAFYPQFVKQGLEPVVSMPEIKLPIRADNTALQRVFNNLIQNALNHGAGDIGINVFVRTERVYIEISNAAPNLTTADVGRIFERAYTADSVRSQAGGGLGLSIVKAFAEQMKGTADAELKEGKLYIRLGFPLNMRTGG